MEQHKQQYFIDRIKHMSNDLETFVKQIQYEYSLDEIPIAHLLNGLLGIVFKDGQPDSPEEVFPTFHIMFYVLACVKETISKPEKQKVVDYILNSIYDIEHTKSLKDFTNTLQAIKSNELFEIFSVMTVITSYCRIHFEMYLEHELMFPDPLPACRIASGESEPWGEYLEYYFGDIFETLRAIE